MANKITKVQKLVAIKNTLEGVTLEVEGMTFNVVEFVDHEIALLNKKAGAKKKKAEKENEVFDNAIVGTLANSGKKMTVTEIINATEVLNGMSTQKVSPMLTRLVSVGTVNKTTEKGKSLYSI